MTNFQSTSKVKNQHRWVTVVNPLNKRALLQACDKCGVVKSENTMQKECSMPDSSSVIIPAALHEIRLIA